LDALFRVIHPHSSEYRTVHNSTKISSIFVYAGVFTLQIWISERFLLTIFSRHGVEGWRTMVNEVNVNRLRDRFIICGYGQVGHTIVDHLQRFDIPLASTPKSRSSLSKVSFSPLFGCGIRNL